MLIDKYGSVNYDVSGVITRTSNIMLADNQFFQWTNTGKRLELWEGKKEYLQYDFDDDDDDADFYIRRVTYWNENSICGFLN